jgi:hypothetical protein
VPDSFTHEIANYRQQWRRIKAHPLGHLPTSLRCLFAFVLLMICSNFSWALPLNDYHKRITQAANALSGLTQLDKSEVPSANATRIAETLRAIRTDLPEAEKVEWGGTTFNIDNSWLKMELDRYEQAPEAERAESLARITERLQAIAEQLAAVEKPGSVNTSDKGEASLKLAEILRRPEYAKKAAGESALLRLYKQFVNWLRSLFPKREPLAPGRANLFSKFAELLVILLALLVIAYAIKMFAPQVLKRRKPKKKKAEARIVLGERLEPDQSAVDLLSEADLLAGQGQLRAAIRKAYVALLVELGDRKIISLAQFKTNRDYLRAVREVEPLYGNVKQLTESFERHWYGFALATDADWVVFRDRYQQALRQ